MATCPRGHEMNAANTYTHPTRGIAICRACRREFARVSQRARYEREYKAVDAYQHYRKAQERI